MAKKQKNIDSAQLESELADVNEFEAAAGADDWSGGAPVRKAQHFWPSAKRLIGLMSPYKLGMVLVFALITVIARVAGVIFFFFLYPGAFPPLFGYIDLILTVLQGSFLTLALLTAGPTVPRPRKASP